MICPAKVSRSTIAAQLSDSTRVAVNPGHSFALPAEQGDGRVRLNAGISLPLLRQVLQRIDAVLEPD